MRTPLTLRGATVRSLIALFAVLLLPGTCLRAQTIFQDDFDRVQLGTSWNANGGWTIRNGQAYNGPDNNWTSLTTARSFAATTYVLETEVTNLVDGYQRAYYLLFGQQHESGEPGYVVRYDPLGAGSLILGEAHTNYLYPRILDRQIITLDPTQSHRIRVAKYTNGLVQVYVGDADGFPDLPTLEAVTDRYPALGKVSWLAYTQSAGKAFYVEYLRADVPVTQKTEPEKPAADGLITALVADSERTYEIGRLTAGEPLYTDRTYTLTSVPDFLENARFIRTANDDKRRTSTDFLTAYLSKRAVAYVAFDPRAGTLPDWLSDWTKIDEVIGSTDPGSDYFELYTKLVPYAAFSPTPYVLRLGANLAAPAAGANMNYLVALVPIASSFRYEAEDALLSGPRPAIDHRGFSGSGFADYIAATEDYIEWTVDVPATSPYNLLMRYANGSSAGRSLQLSVDGKAVSLESFRPTGSWKNWSSRSMGPSVLLSAGTHRIRLTAMGDSGPNVDYLQLSPTSVYTPPASGLAQTVLPPQAFLDRDVAPVASLSVFPNPAVHALTFRWEEAGAGQAELRIVDARGREVHRQRLEARAGAQLRIAVDHWPVGTYAYQLVSGAQLLTGQFVKAQ
ncbi:hypothetical protein LEM8419_02076 [Neolewinella maritima]|uniref:CBM6 domain-containing protein n=1 Tax=Neolewinella maritima TaxID=1383882 RepID=A0ABM9B232_9BACT|nr:carbohydrate-binding protein [Neolewinella maritima]CAH1001168.1 hypothetical protein LEM8419_02076 [Neolewinella maritima]